MASLEQIYGWFKRGFFPTEDQYKQTFSSFLHRSERLPITQILGLNNALDDKASKDDLQNASKGFIPMGDALDMADLLSKPKVNNHSYYVLDQKDENGNYYIFRYDVELNTWVNTKLIAYSSDVVKNSDVPSLKVGVGNVLNGVSSVYGDVGNFKGYSDININEDWIEFTHIGVGNSWLSSPAFAPKGYNKVHIRFNVEIVGGSGIRVTLVGNPKDSSTWHNIQSINQSGEYDVIFDPQTYFDKGYTKFEIWLVNNTMTAEQSIVARYRGLKVYGADSPIVAKHIEGINTKELFESTDNQFTNIKASMNVGGVVNGLSITYGDVNNFTQFSDKNIKEDWIEFTYTGTGNSWLKSPTFVPKGNNLVHVKFNIEIQQGDKGARVILVGDEKDANTWIVIKNFTEQGDYDITFDPAYYTVYHGFTKFQIWIANNKMTEGGTFKARYKGLKVFELDNVVNAANIEGTTTKELFESTDKVLTEIKSSLNESSDELISPSGSKFELSVLDNGSIVAIPIIPNKAKFFGNSLIGGYGYGMAASAVDRDYYYLINNCILRLNPNYTASKVQANVFEGLTDLSKVDSTIQSAFLNNLAGDEDLVVLQLGDNVNTPEKFAVFEHSALKLCKAIRAHCPKARIFWMGMWYPTTAKYKVIQDACNATGCKFVSFAGIRNKPNVESKVGNLTKRGTATRTLENVTKVVENSATNITVTFTVGANSYESQPLDVTSYSLDGTTLTYGSEYQIISHSGEATHPGDEGFRLIANLLLFAAKLTNDTEYYKKVV